MARISKKERDSKIVAQVIEEIRHARQYKQGRVRKSWDKNEDLYYGHKIKSDESRANVDLGQMQEHVHTLLSKIDSPLTFKFLKRKEAQGPRVDRCKSMCIRYYQKLTVH
jgi:hypothetical protein